MLRDNCAILSYLIDKLQLILNWANIAVKQAGHEIHFATSTNTSTGKSSFFMKDIYYSNYKERVKKKLITKLQTTVITEGEKKGKALHTYNYLHSTIIAVERP